MFFEKQGLQVLWQCGKLYYEEYKKHESNSVKVLAFVNRMDLAYATADVIISRAGAGSVSELCLVGKPVIFIPSPNVAEDHQTQNAKALVAKEEDFLPADLMGEVVAHTGLLGPGESETIFFDVPEEAGPYKFLCSFPGHFGTMQGLFFVRQ